MQPSLFFSRSLTLGLLLIVLLAIASLSATFAGSATWSSNPIGGDWNTAANWIPNSFPNDPTAVATFDVSDETDISLSGPIQVAEIVFNPGASAFTITKLVPSLRIMGAGITNNSGIVQNLVSGYLDAGGGTKIALYNSATISPLVNLTIYGGLEKVGTGQEGGLLFYDNSSAGDATILIDDPFYYNYFGSLIEFNDQSTAGNSHITLRGEVAFAESDAFFWDDSTAGNATITMEGDDSCVIQFRDNSSAGYANITIEATTGNISAGQAYFYDGATADHATLVVDGATTQGGSGALLFLGVAAADATVIVQGGSEHNAGGGSAYLSTTTGNATITVNGGSNGGFGGYCNVDADSGAARVEIFGNGILDGSGQVGSIEGDGLITGDFTVGTNNLSTVFSGVISGNTLTKVGTGTLTLAGASTYTTQTAVLLGTLLVENRHGSATGDGPVFVNAGTLGGRGIISGAVTIGGEGSASSLAPSSGSNKTMTLTIRGALTLTADATYVCKVNLQHAAADKVTANGVAINPAAVFSLLKVKHGTLTVGTKFTVINNTSANPINGTFANLADKAVISTGGNNFQADYEGGDGNDLTLTVVP